MSSLLEMISRFLLAAALGAGIGYQRERAGKAAGIRTHILVSSGAALFTLVSIYGFSGAVVDISRVAAGVVVGIGFIGAGVILRGLQCRRGGRANHRSYYLGNCRYRSSCRGRNVFDLCYSNCGHRRCFVSS